LEGCCYDVREDNSQHAIQTYQLNLVLAARGLGISVHEGKRTLVSCGRSYT